MKLRIALLAYVLGGFPTWGWSQSVLRFPRVFPLTELTSTGFTVVNPNTSNTTASFALISRNGMELTRADFLVPAKGQFSKLGSELFPNAPEAGWVEATSSANGLRGFWLGGDFATFADG